jgi:diadenosine tetraphosphate (Ap4A) HIT family hydrolase
MAENIDQILERLLAKNGQTKSAESPPLCDRSADLLIEAMSKNKTKATPAGKARIQLSADQITSPVHIIAPSQIAHIAEVFASDMAAALNMRAMLPKIQKVAEQSLRAALGVAKKQGANPPVK